MRFTIYTIFLILISTQALAEYRVFTLHIINSTTQATRQIETTLDPEQYITFYPLRASEQISYIETWLCKGRTDFFKSHCNNPRLNTADNKAPTVGSAAKLDQNPAGPTSQSPELLN